MSKLPENLLQPNRFKRTIFFLLCDSFIIGASLYCSFLIRFDFSISAFYQAIFLKALPVFLLLKLALFASFGLYKFTWRYVDVNYLGKIYISSAIAASALMVLILIPFGPGFSDWPLPYIEGFPRSIFLIDALLSSLLLSGLRISKRLYLEKIALTSHARKGLKTIVIGAGSTGEMILRDVYQRGYADFHPVGLLDDDIAKLGGYIRGIKVLGPIVDLRQVIRKQKAEALIVAIPSLNHKTLKKIYGAAKECGLQTIKIVPRIYDFHRPEINLKNLEEISIEDLIGRQTIKIDQETINNFIKGKTVLVTGAGGSIGSEIVMQVCSFEPACVILFDIDETELHNISLRIKRALPHIEEKCRFITGDVRDDARVDEVFRAFSPGIVFHAAAYKHVPMMESNPKEAIKVNIFGTYTLVKAASRYECSRFILISTDKAIRPTSIMGSSKRIAEYICRAFNGLAGKTEYISVRFGNVLGSRGSVLPLFLDQLRHGGPITITHPEMRRYFMTIPEAVSLVLEASVIGKGGEVMVLDMGEPVMITTLAEELIRLHGLNPYVDIDIVFTGLRPGEKLFEELLTAEEGTVATKHEKIFIARDKDSLKIDKIDAMLREMEDIVLSAPFDDAAAIRSLLSEYVTFYSAGKGASQTN
jgi:FlaA1/EpsC-like NDP-sugar epimerase